MIPHEFTELRSASRSPAIIYGTGLSAGRVPAPLALINEVKANAEAALECGVIGGLPNSNDALYQWAEEALARISAVPGRPPKLRLAQAIGLLTDRRWAVDVDLNGALARHRVIARFAREELWASIWSLNWDCMLESALENIGFVRGTALRSQPWLTRYGTVVTDGDFLQIGSPGSLLCILKPHGCVHALMNAEIKFNQGDVAAAETLSSRFLITASELQKIRTDITDQKFFNQMVSELQAKPLLVAGWSISEPYLRAVIEKRLAALLGQGKVEDLSIVDILFNDQGHKEIVDCYKLSKGDVFFEVAHLNNVFDIDEFFLWLQTKFCIDQLEIAAPNLVEPLKAIGDLSVSSALDQFLVSWADKFLPAWTLFCWRSKIIDCAGFQPQELDLDRRNEYVPWRIPKNLPRPDLVAAARFLIAIAPQRSIWNLEKFPGALFRSSDARLVIPVPAWRTLDELSGIRPLIKGWASELSFVEKVDLVPMSPTSDPINIEAFSKQFSKAVASFMPVPRFSNPANIGVATDLLGQG